jgi:prepilin-type processing-associated H-X9-DG protein
MKTDPKPLTGNCDSCLMPLAKDPKGASREHADYCSYCFFDGHLAYDGDDVNEFKRGMIEAITARGQNVWKARLFAFMAGFAPRWKKKS